MPEPVNGIEADRVSHRLPRLLPEILERLPLEQNSDDFVFDNQMLAQVIFYGYRIGEISCPAKYFAEASSINFRRSCVYGLGCLRTGLQFRLARARLTHPRIFRRPLHEQPQDREVLA